MGDRTCTGCGALDGSGVVRNRLDPRDFVEVHVRHRALARAEVQGVLRRWWPDVAAAPGMWGPLECVALDAAGRCAFCRPPEQGSLPFAP